MTIIWEESALDELADVWLRSGERRQINAAVAEIENRLRFNPANQGESRPNDRRILWAPPLGVTFRVVTDTVYILRVWAVRKRRA